MNMWQTIYIVMRGTAMLRAFYDEEEARKYAASEIGIGYSSTGISIETVELQK